MGNGKVISDQDLYRTITELLEAHDHPSADIEITDRTPLAEGGLELTSLDLVRLLVGLEDRLGIEIEDMAIMNANFDSVDDIAFLIRSSSGILMGPVSAASG